VPEIPDKPFYKIGEVCQYTDTQPYVLRFWESEFPQLAPEKSRSGQRMYTRLDIDLVLRIKKLLYEEEFTIAGARKKLEQEESGEPADDEPQEPEPRERAASESPDVARETVSVSPEPAHVPEPRIPETLFPETILSQESAKQEEAPPQLAAPSAAERARAAVAETEIAVLRKRIADLEARSAEAATAIEAAGEARLRDRERREKVAARLESLLRSLDGPAEGGAPDTDRA
jgi:DNA-binding transcriptional MerR regulator